MERAGAIIAGLLLACAPRAFALNPALDISQYAHTPWKYRDGLSKGGISSMAQTADGYLWLGTEFGLLRFDGVRSVPWEPPAGEKLPSSYIRKLLVSRDGTLWIGTNKGLASWKGGELTHYAELAGTLVGALREDGDGTLWASSRRPLNGKVCAIREGKVRCYGEDGRFGQGVLSFYEYNGYLWAGAANGLWRWKPDPPKLYPDSRPIATLTDLIEGDNGMLWIATPDGMRQLVNGKMEVYSLPDVGQFVPFRLLRDRDGGLWIGTSDRGIVHLHEGRTDVFTSTDGLTADRITTLFEDREGNIWAASSEGLDRFHGFVVPTISRKQGLSSDRVYSVLAAGDGSVWLGTGDGLNRWSNGQLTIYRKPSPLRSRPAPHPGVRVINDDGLPDNSLTSLFQDDRGRIWVSTGRGLAYFEEGRFVPIGSVPTTMVHFIAEEGNGNFWIDDQNLGLFHLRNGKLIEQIPWARLERKDFAIVSVADRVKGGLWLGFYQSGLAHFKDSQVQASYTSAAGLGEGAVTHLSFDRDGTLWAATDGGLSRIKDGRIVTLTGKNGLPCDVSHWAMEDDARSLWVSMPCGLVSIARSELNTWAANPSRKVNLKFFSSSEGVRNPAGGGGISPRVAKSSDGRIWFRAVGGVSIIDPLHLPINKLPPPVRIEQITADRKAYDLASNPNLRLPPVVRDLQIDYTALSFAAPEKVNFRYKLEGQDADWTEVVNQRQVHYSNLGPRNYRFRVMACNNSGVWNETGASFDFSVAPAYYQSTWFLASCMAAPVALLAGLYQLRIRYLKHQFNIRLDARVGERTRIARDLHDTLLQSFQGTLLKFHALSYMLPDHPEARKKLESCIEQARTAIVEARDAVQGLRSSTVVSNDLACSITTFGNGLSADQSEQNCPGFSVLVKGESRDLPPLVRDEVYHIACEALRNAFRHAQAKRIEVEIEYNPRRFSLRVVDDGKGIDEAVLSAGGRVGHHGLPGIHERAERAGGKLSVWTRPDSGTKIELIIPGSIAYTKSPPGRPDVHGKGAVTS